jgi:hypothetical protein
MITGVLYVCMDGEENSIESNQQMYNFLIENGNEYIKKRKRKIITVLWKPEIKIDFNCKKNDV